MFWEELTSDLFPEAVKAAGGVCLLPLSVLERHGHHLPVGTDKLIGRELCRRAAELEPAIVFADYIFTQILEARHYPGAIGLDPELILHLLEAVCREIARNGLKKIVLVSSHGGNYHLTRYLAQAQLASKRDYVLYVVDPSVPAAEEKELDALFSTGIADHAGDSETSCILAIRPELVHLDKAPADGEGSPLNRLQALDGSGAYTGIWWYANYPYHYAGDARPAAAEKGERLLDAEARALAAAIRLIKQDDIALRLQNEFFGRI